MLGSVDKFQHCKRLIGMEHYYTGEMDYTGVGLDRFYCLYQFEELMGFT